MRLPFADATFDGATMGFSMRNVVDIVATLREARRVLRPGARFVNLDVTQAGRTRSSGALFGLYFYGLVPLVGGIVGGSKTAYRYLPNSLTNFPDADGLAERFRSAGFRDVRYDPARLRRDRRPRRGRLDARSARRANATSTRWSKSTSHRRSRPTTR